MEDTVWLHRPNEEVPWGFRLQGGRDFQQPLTVQKVSSGSVAGNSLNSGDVILRIGDAETASLTHSQAMMQIKNCGNSLELGISRGGIGATVTSPKIQPQQRAYPEAANDYSSSYPFGEPPTYSSDSGFGQGSPVSNGQQAYSGYGGEYDLDSSYSSDAGQAASQKAQASPQRMPDAILNMAAKGGSDKKPFAYIADVNDIKEHRDRVRKKNPISMMPRYQHVLNMPQFEDTPRARSLPRTPATPPVQNPDSGDAIVANLQFNSPLQLYSSDNVVEALKGQTGGMVQDVVGLRDPKRDPKIDITQSPVYKMIHGIDQPRAKPVVKFAEAQPQVRENTGGSEIDYSSIRKNVSGDEAEPGSYDEKSIRYIGKNIPSKSFRLLQSMTGGPHEGDSTPPTVRRPVREPSSDDEVRFSGLNRSTDVPSKTFQRLQIKTASNQNVQPQNVPNVVGTSQGSSEIDRSSIRKHLGGHLGDDLEDAGEYEQSSIRYTGRNIPSKSFRMLQSMTGSDSETASPPPGSHPAARRQQQRRPPQQHQQQYQQQHQQHQNPADGGEQQNPDDVVDIRYVGGHIPSQSFRMLQHSVGANDAPGQGQGSGDTLASAQGKRVKVVRLRSQASQDDSGSTDF